MIGQLLDHRYQVTGILAKGGFGQTYLAQDTRRPGHPTCVVKQLCPPTNNPEALSAIHRLFNSEAEVLERLGRHDQIPQLLAHFDEDQEFYLVQEFISGHPLSDEILPGQTWSEAKTIEFLAGILDVLAFVHHQGVIHRDIKPANIIRRIPDNKLVLIDFGAVKELTTSVALNKPTINIGTPAYIAIEQFRGYPQFNSDIYSVGVIAIQAATGLGVDDLASLLDPNNPHRGDQNWRSYAQLSPELIALLDKMTSPGYQKRYQTVSEVLTDLKRLVEKRNVGVPATVVDAVIQAEAAQPVTDLPKPRSLNDAIAPPSDSATRPGAIPNTVIDPVVQARSYNTFDNQTFDNQTFDHQAQSFFNRHENPAYSFYDAPDHSTSRSGMSGLVKLLLWTGGSVAAIVVLGCGLLVLRYVPRYLNRVKNTVRTESPTPAVASTTSPTSSNYLKNLRACETNSEHICSRDNIVFEDNKTRSIQVIANLDNLVKGDKVEVVVKYRGVNGTTEKPYPAPYEVQGLNRERMWATLDRPTTGWEPGVYTFEFLVQGKSNTPVTKRLVMLKDDKIRQ